MKRIINAGNPIKLLLIGMVMSVSTSSFSQKIKPASTGYAPVNGIKMYYEVYGEGKPIILLHGS